MKTDQPVLPSSIPVIPPRPAVGDRKAALPGVFLMINSFETGGSERQFEALANALSPEAFRLYLGCLVQRGTFLEKFRDIPAFGMGGSLYRWKSITSRIRLARYLRKVETQIAHAFDFYTNIALIPAARLARVPVVIGSQRQLGDLLTPAQYRVQLAAFRWCDAVVCNSCAAGDRLVADGLPPAKVVIIRNGLPDTAFAKVEPALPRSSGRLRVGMVARMNALSKNHGLFLRAAARLCDHQNPALDFVLVGDGPFRPDLEREADALGIRNRVSFLGDRRDIPAVLASFDISVLPSASESLSNVILESMAAGLPVIASDVGGNPELLGEERGVLVTPGDETALAQAIESLANHPQRRADIALRSNEFARANFGMDQMRHEYERLYAELLGRKNCIPR